MEVISKSRFVRNAPDKIRIFSTMLKKKTIEEAISQLDNTSKFASKPLILVLKQAKSIIKDKNGISENFIIKQIQVDEGPKLKRRRMRLKGQSTAILKRMSHITIVLSDDGESKTNSKKQIIKSKQVNKSLEIRNSNSEIGATKGATDGSKS